MTTFYTDLVAAKAAREAESAATAARIEANRAAYAAAQDRESAAFATASSRVSEAVALLKENADVSFSAAAMPHDIVKGLYTFLATCDDSAPNPLTFEHRSKAGDCLAITQAMVAITVENQPDASGKEDWIDTAGTRVQAYTLCIYDPSGREGAQNAPKPIFLDLVSPDFLKPAMSAEALAEALAAGVTLGAEWVRALDDHLQGLGKYDAAHPGHEAAASLLKAAYMPYKSERTGTLLQ